MPSYEQIVYLIFISG